MNVNILGLNANYIDEGEGENILLLHGWGCNAGVLSPIMNLLKTRYRVIAVDLPGFGGTDEPKTPYGVSEYAAFVLEFLEKIGVSKTILIGHSLGGRTIIKMMAQRPPLIVPKIVLIDSAGVLPKKSLKKRVRIRLFKIGRAFFSLPPVKALFPKAIEKLKRNSGSADYRNASEMMRKCLVKVVNEDLTPFFALNTADTLLLWGENDMETPLEHAKIMERLMPKAGLAVVKNAGHYPFLEQPAVFNRIMASYLDL